MSASASARSLGLAKLKTSGLTPGDAKAFGIDILSGSQTSQLSSSFYSVPSLRLNYFAPSGKPTGFFRLRYLQQVNGFDALTTRPQRYVQPPKTMPEIYWPKGVNWAQLAGDPSKAVYLTEGELKACCASSMDLPTIAVGGVWSWRSSKEGLGILPTLTPAGWIWERRQIYIIFDSDASTKPDVATARLALCEQLTSLGAQPLIVDIPPVEGFDKTGLDDFLVSRSIEEFYDLVAQSKPFVSSRALWEMSSEIAYIKDPGLIVVLQEGRKLAPNAFLTHAYANRHYDEVSTKADGSTKITKKSLAKAWLEWEHRSELARLTYAPGAEQITAVGEYNMWRGWGCEPRKGNVEPWEKLLDFVFKKERDSRYWFERWCAYPLQHPGTKLYTAAVIWGIVNGTGKSLIGYSLGKIYGNNFTEIGEEQLHASFNEWAEGKQFVMGDDVTSSDRRGGKGYIREKLKNLITQQYLRVNAKFLPSFVVPDCVNYYFTANPPDAFFLEDTDRRYFVHELVGNPMPKEFYRVYDEWLHSDGPSALFHHLLHLDLGDFNPKAPAPWTQSKKMMALDSKSDVASWVAELKENPNNILKVGNVLLEGDLFTPAELLALYDPEKRTRVSANGIGREMKRAGFRFCNGGTTIRTEHGPRRLYAVRHPDKWDNVSAAVAAAHYDARFDPDPDEEPLRKDKF